MQELINVWHDAQGLCRAITEGGHQPIISIDRHVDTAASKCNQRIHCLHNQILMPRFCNPAGDITFDTFVLYGVIFHMGATPHTGHYRAGLKHKGRMMMAVFQKGSWTCRRWYVEIPSCSGLSDPPITMSGHWPQKALRFEPSTQRTILCSIRVGEQNFDCTAFGITQIFFRMTSSRLLALAAAFTCAFWLRALELWRCGCAAAGNWSGCGGSG